MYRTRVNFLILLVSIIFIVLVSILLIFESIKMNDLKEKSFEDFIFFKNNLLKSDNSSFPAGMKDSLSSISNLFAFRIQNDTDQTIYFFSKSGLTRENNSDFKFQEIKSIYNVVFNHKIKLSNRSYNIDAAFTVFSHSDLYLLLIKFSIIIFTYLFFIIIFLILNNNSKSSQKYKEAEQKLSGNNSDKQLVQKITDELKKSASFDQDIVLTLIGSYGTKIKDNKTDFCEMLKKHFQFHDLIFKFNDNIFGILLPNMDLEKGIQHIEQFDQTFVGSSSTSLKFPIMFGLSSRNGRLISGNIILKEAKAALNKAMSDKDFPIIGFRPNPARYREYLSKLKPNL